MAIPSIGLIGKDRDKLVWSVISNGNIHIWREGELSTYCGRQLFYATATTDKPDCEECIKKSEFRYHPISIVGDKENGLA